MIGVLVVIVLVAVLPYNLRIFMAHRAYGRMSPDARRAVLDLLSPPDTPPYRLPIDRTLHVFDHTGETDPRVGSHLGGHPYLESVDHWPLDGKGRRAEFIGQVLLSHPSLPEVWHGRLVVFFATPEGGRVYTAPSRDRAIGIDRAPAEPCVPLAPIGVRAAGDESYRTTTLLAELPSLDAILRAHHHRTDLLLAKVLTGGRHAAEINDADLVLEGTPSFIQGAATPSHCVECDAPLRFLAQVPAGECVIYAYGCDAHPEQVVFGVQCY